LDSYSASSPKEQSAGRNVIPIQPVLLLYDACLAEKPQMPIS